MKWTTPLVGMLVVAIFAGALHLRSLDPRPANLAMQGELEAALDGLRQTLAENSSNKERWAEGYSTLLRTAAIIGARYVSDVNLLRYASMAAERPSLDLQACVGVADLDAINGRILVAVDVAASHVGTPDDRFYEFMLPLEQGLAEIGRLADPKRPASAMRASDPATLMAASAAVALAKWGDGSGHSH